MARPRFKFAVDPRAIRLGLGLSQAEFALVYQLPVATIRDWESGRRRPNATACAYLKLIRDLPDAQAILAGTAEREP